MASENQFALLTKRRSRWMSICAAAVSMMIATKSFALGLGEIRVRSGLGQTLLAHTDLIGNDAESLNVSCLRARVNSIDGQFLTNANVVIYAHQNKRALSFTTRQPLNEPAVILVVDVNCEVQLHREFSILLDPPEATPASLAQARDESPFAGKHSDVPKIGGAESISDSQQPKKQKQRAVTEPKGVSSVPIDRPRSEPKVQKKSAKVATKAPRDVLKLSDEVIIPELGNLPSGLRMSDVLSSEAGRELVQNSEELRAAQARMAAILRDEPLSVASVPASSQNDVSAIADLKRETEMLRRQSAMDKAALEALQNKSQFDLWLILLSGVAVVAVGVIGFLLYYIRSHVKRGVASWWESNPELARLDAESESLIPDFHVDIAQSESTKGGGKLESGANAAVATVDSSKTATPHLEGDSGFHRTPTLEETNSSIFNFFSPRGTSVKVEEISDVTQEAEFWISMNDPRRAIEILEPQERVEDPDSPVPWLFLLDLYRTVQEAEKYNQLRDRFIVHFNANIPEYEADLANMPQRQLEDFGHIVSRICTLWETHEIIPYLESLLVDDREGKRTGFDLPVYRDILMLLGIAHELERLRAIEAEMQGIANQGQDSQATADKVDPVSEAEFNMIEFETIDFPAIDLDAVRKKK